ncbi:hypothetical protein GCM10027403_04240 [Arthrobacter tecti]
MPNVNVACVGSPSTSGASLEAGAVAVVGVGTGVAEVQAVNPSTPAAAIRRTKDARNARRRGGGLVGMVSSGARELGRILTEYSV